MKYFDCLKSKTTLVCRSAVMAFAAMIVGVTALTAVPQGVAAQDSRFFVKSCHGIEVGIEGKYDALAGKTTMRYVSASDSDMQLRDNHDIKIEHKRGDDWVEVFNREDLLLGGFLYQGEQMEFNKSPDGVVVSGPPTEIRFEIKADKPGKDYTCTGERRVLL